MSKKSILNILSSTNIGLNCLMLCVNLYMLQKHPKTLRIEILEFEEKRAGYINSGVLDTENSKLRARLNNLMSKFDVICLGSIIHILSTGLAITTLCINNLTKSKVAPIITFGLSTTMLLASIAIEKDSLFTLTKSSEPNR